MAAPTAPLVDDGTGTNGASLGAGKGWQAGHNPNPAPQYDGTGLIKGGGTQYTSVSRGLSLVNVEMAADLVTVPATADEWVGFYLRFATNAQTGYEAFLLYSSSANDTSEIDEISGGVFTMRAQDNTTNWGAGDSIFARALDSGGNAVVEIFRKPSGGSYNSVATVAWTDTTPYGAADVELEVFSTTSRIDNVIAGAPAAAAAAGPPQLAPPLLMRLSR